MLNIGGTFAENECISYKRKLCWTRLFVPELTLPKNFDIMIYGFLSAFQVKENQNNWSTFGNMKKLSHGCNQTFESFSSKHLILAWDFCLHVRSWFIDFMKAKDQPSCVRIVATMWWYAGELDNLKWELLLKVNVQVNCNRIPLSSVYSKEILVSQIVL